MANLTATSVKVKVTKDGYPTIYQDGKTTLASAAAVPLTPAGTTTINITVPSLQTVTGKVTSGGTPVSGARIALFNAATGAGIGSTTTNSSGVYTMANLAVTSVKVKSPRTATTPSTKTVRPPCLPPRPSPSPPAGQRQSMWH